MAIIASKGPVRAVEASLAGLMERDVRSEAEPRRSAAAPTTPEEEDWTCEAEYNLKRTVSVQQYTPSSAASNAVGAHSRKVGEADA